MKRILISLSIIGVVAMVAIGVTVALFNDTETSTGNIFVAGEMDLKVDHLLASYNGNPCVENCQEGTTNLIQNGGFEFPEVTNGAGWQVFANGTPSLIWTVEWEPGQPTTYLYNGTTYNRPEAALTEHHEGVAGWISQEGNQHAELDSDWFGPSSPVSGEPGLVKIWQNVNTIPGVEYKLRYYFSARPNNGGGGNGTGDNVLKVRIDGNQVDTWTQSNNTSQTQWIERVTTFTATNAVTKVEFAAGGTANSLGVFLDNVRMYEMVCDYQIIGGTCTLWDLKDLGPNDYYWHYGPDMKPGDWGRNVISLHAFSNDAWACLIVHDIQDDENTLIEPEEDAGDTTPGPVGEGELSSHIELMLWMDDGDGIYEPPGETVLVSNILTAGNFEIADSNLGYGPLIASHDYYIGLAWCFGAQTSNPDGTIICNGGSTEHNFDDSQTDSMVAKMTLYAEQWRNNPNFRCADVNLQPK
jgi:predicted ribosomally synthesized peptide with SipW-like signal peptide